MKYIVGALCSAGAAALAVSLYNAMGPWEPISSEAAELKNATALGSFIMSVGLLALALVFHLVRKRMTANN